MQTKWFPIAVLVVSSFASCEDCSTSITGGKDVTVVANEPLWILDQPYPDIANLNGVWGYSHDDVWAVGSAGVILHWDGNSWSPVPTPTDEDLFDIDGHETMEGGDADIYAVGSSGTIIHWDGVIWSKESDNPPIADLRTAAGLVDNTLMGVWHGGSQGVFVVGESGTILVKERDPAAPQNSLPWRLMHAELVQDRLPVCETRIAYDGDGYPYDGGGGICAGCVIAIPNGAPADLPMPLWQCLATGTQTVPYCAGPDFSATDCELPSTMRRGADPQCSFGQRCEGTSGALVPAYQTTFYHVDLKAVVGYGSGANLRVVAVGESGAIVELRADGSSSDETSWNCEGLVPSLRPPFCWRPVGRAGNSDNPSVRDTLSGVWGTWDSNIFAVGEDGRIMWRRSDDAWVRGTDVTQDQWVREFLTPPTPVLLRDLWHQGRNDFFAVGFSGVVLHQTESGWGVEQVPTTAHLRAIWGKTREDLDAGSRDLEAPPLRSIFVVGAEGVILRRAIDR